MRRKNTDVTISLRVSRHVRTIIDRHGETLRRDFPQIKVNRSIATRDLVLRAITAFCPELLEEKNPKEAA